MECKSCKEIITENNAVRREKGKWRKNCRQCENKRILEWSKKNNEKRILSRRKYNIKIGKGLFYSCETCGNLCKKKSKRAFCGEKCRFMSFVRKTEECWLWQGKIGNSGYGSFNQKELAHRTAFRLFKSPLQEGKVVCHTCDNPLCVNPNHLWEGTQKENINDSIKKGRFR